MAGVGGCFGGGGFARESRGWMASVVVGADGGCGGGGGFAGLVEGDFEEGVLVSELFWLHDCIAWR